VPWHAVSLPSLVVLRFVEPIHALLVLTWLHLPIIDPVILRLPKHHDHGCLLVLFCGFRFLVGFLLVIGLFVSTKKE